MAGKRTHHGVGDAGEQGVEAGGHQRGRVAGAHGGESAEQAGDGVAAGGAEDHGGQRRHDDEGGVGHHRGGHADHADGVGQQGLVGAAEELADQRGEHPGALGDADGEHDRQHGNQGREADVVLGDVLGQPHHALAGEQPLDVELLVGAGHGDRDAGPRHHRGGQGGDQEEVGEQEEGGGQLVAHLLDAVEGAVAEAGQPGARGVGLRGGGGGRAGPGGAGATRAGPGRFLGAVGLVVHEPRLSVDSAGGETGGGTRGPPRCRLRAGIDVWCSSLYCTKVSRVVENGPRTNRGRCVPASH